jgi:hypothetical protein
MGSPRPNNTKRSKALDYPKGYVRLPTGVAGVSEAPEQPLPCDRLATLLVARLLSPVGLVLLGFGPLVVYLSSLVDAFLCWA